MANLAAILSAAIHMGGSYTLLRTLALRLNIMLLTFGAGVIASALWVSRHSSNLNKIKPPISSSRSETTDLLNNQFVVKAISKSTSVFDPSGDYHPDPGKASEAERFTYFDLEMKRIGDKLLAWGHVYSHGTFYKFAVVSTTEERLTFTTVSVEGVKYSFDGRFLGGGRFAERFTGGGMVMLEGTLQKFIKGRKEVELNVPFVYYPGC